MPVRGKKDRNPPDPCDGRWIDRWIDTLGRPTHLAIFAASLLLLSCLWGQAQLIGTPITGYHSWRGAATYSVAWNYAHTSLNFFLPIVDWRNEWATGVTTMEMPGYPYLCGMAMRMFGDAPAVCRIINFAAQLLALLVWAYASIRTARPLLAVGLFLGWAILPPVAMEFRQIQPDPFLVSWAFIAASLLYLYGQYGARTHYVLGLVAYGLSCASKPTAIGLAPAMLLMSVAGRPRSLRQWVRRGVPMLIPVAMALGWDRWSHHAQQSYHLCIFDIFLPFDAVMADLKNPGTWRSMISTWIPIQVAGWLGWPLLLIGMGVSLSRRHRSLSLPFGAWLLASVFVAAVTANRIPSNLYYLDPLIVPCAYFIGLAVEAPLHLALERSKAPVTLVFDRIGPVQSTRPPASMSDWPSTWATTSVLLVCLVWLVFGRKQAGSDLASATTFWLQGEGAVLGSLIIVLGAASTEVLARRYRWCLVLGLVAFAAVLATAPTAQADAQSYASDFAQRSPWVDPEVGISQLREAVNRYSTRENPILVTGREPKYLHWALRWGWALSTAEIEPAIVQPTATQGPTLNLIPRPRIVVHFKEAALPGGMSHWSPLEQTDVWAIYCADPNGCSPSAVPGH